MEFRTQNTCSAQIISFNTETKINYEIQNNYSIIEMKKRKTYHKTSPAWLEALKRIKIDPDQLNLKELKHSKMQIVT